MLVETRLPVALTGARAFGGMSTAFIEKCTKIASADGVLAVAVEVPGHDLAFLEDAAWRPRLRAVHLTRAEFDEPMVRLLAGGVTVIAQREPAGVVVVAVPSSHPVVKSIHRMIRRAGRLPREGETRPAGDANTPPRKHRATRKPEPLPDPAKLVAHGAALAQPITVAEAFG